MKQWMDIIDRAIETRLGDVCTPRQVELLLSERKRTLNRVRWGNSKGWLLQLAPGVYEIETTCGDLVEQELIVWHEVAHWITLTLYNCVAHDHRWAAIITALGFPRGS